MPQLEHRDHEGGRDHLPAEEDLRPPRHLFLGPSTHAGAGRRQILPPSRPFPLRPRANRPARARLPGREPHGKGLAPRRTEAWWRTRARAPSGTGPGKPVASAETISASASNPSGLAGRYALALLGLADDRRQTDPGTVDRIAADLDRLFTLWRDDEGFRAFVADPRLGSASQKLGAFAILDRVGIGAEVRNLIGVLIANRRLRSCRRWRMAFGGLLGGAPRPADRAGHQRTSAERHPARAAQRAADGSRVLRRQTRRAGGSFDPRRADPADRLAAL